MGNRASNVASPTKSFRRKSPVVSQRQSSYAPREIEQVEEVQAPRRSHKRQSVKIARVVLPRDPTTGRYLPRGQRASSPRGRRGAPRAASPRRRVEVEVIAAPQVIKSRSRGPKQYAREQQLNQRVSFVESEDPQVSQFRSEAPAEPQQSEEPRAPRRRLAPRQLASEVEESQRHAASPRQPRKAARSAIETEEPRVRVRSPPRRAASSAAELDIPEEPRMEASPRGAQILRSSYTRCDAPEVREMQVAAPRARSASPGRRQAPQAALPVSRREYASPSLASRESENQVTIAPSTTRNVRRMAASDVSELPVERLSHSSPASPADLLFSYLGSS